MFLCPLAGQETGGERHDDNYDDFLDFGESPRAITVTGTPETTQQKTVIDKETIEKSGARDLAALLEEEIDMSIVRYGGYGNKTEMNLRGFDTERIAILIDGVPANSPRSGEFDISRIDLNNVERIEVIYGGSDTKYNVSGALGGVINIITIKKQNPGLTLGVTFSNTGYMPGKYNKRHAMGAIGEPEFVDLVDMQSINLSAGYGAEKFSWKSSLFGNSAGNHYLYKDDYGFARRKVSNEVLDGGGNFQLMFALPKDASILSDTKLYYARRNFPITMNSVGSAIATDLTVNENIIFAAPVIFRDDLAAEGSMSYQASHTAYGANISGYDHYLTAINRWGWYPSQKITVRSGIDWRFLFINTDSPTELQPVKTGNQGGLYITGEYKPLKNLLLVGSVKTVTDAKQIVAVPKLGLNWQVRPFFTLKNNYFRSFKFPDFDDLYYRSPDNVFVGNPNLKPEDGCGADLIGEFMLEKYFSLVSTVFWQWTTDSIHWVKSQGGRWSPENAGTACFTGADFRPVFTLPLDKGNFTSLKIGASYQFQFSWLMNGGLDFENSFRIPYMPTHIIGGTVDLAWKTGSVFISAHYESTRYADTMNQMALDPHCVVHATLNQKAGKHLTFFASLRNILNTQYESFASYYMPGISLVCGIRSKFNLNTNKGDSKNE
ncbi:MAG: TonB-dependent receptor [Spirochaetaceae bacterium]|jgi:outer membrane cobalamin receptor|nr:TonB-dependent receptor [Spirochaetaceae bacterium]